MDRDNDVEKLFSWLQTPDIRYREFADARDVSDAALTRETRIPAPEVERPAPHNAQLNEEYPANQFPDQSQTEVTVEPSGATHSGHVAPPSPAGHEPPTTRSKPGSPVAPPPPASADNADRAGRPLDSVFNRLAGGRASDRDPNNGRSR